MQKNFVESIYIFTTIGDRFMDRMYFRDVDYKTVPVII